MSRDPIQEEGGESLYLFVGNTPANGVDPDGLKPFYCGWLEGKIRSFLTSAKDIRAWNNFVSGSKKDIQLSDSEMKSIIKGSSKFAQKRDARKKQCDDSSTPNWFAVVDTISDTIGAPWSASIGGVSIKFTSTCVCRCLIWSAEINDYYDFDIKGVPYFSGRPDGEAEAKTWMVKIAQTCSLCGWEEFYHKGDTFGSCGSGCEPPYTP